MTYHSGSGAGGTRVRRIDGAGRVDAGFSDMDLGTGVAIVAGTGVNDHTIALAIAVGADGRVVVAGETPAQEPDPRPYLIRLLPGGQHDLTFGVAGLVRFEGAGAAGATAVLLDGERTVIALTGVGTPYRCGLAAFTSAGRPDSTFGPGGVRWFDAGPRACASQAVVSGSDGYVLAADLYDTPVEERTDYTSAAFAIRRDGSPWGSFGASGRVDVGPPMPTPPRTRLVRRGTGFVLAHRVPCGTVSCIALDGRTRTGQPDDTFGAGGTATDATVAWDLFDVAADGEGRVLLAGPDESAAGRVFATVRRTAAGDLDMTYGSGGLSALYSSGASIGPFGTALALDSEGRAVVLTTEFSGTTAYQFPVLIRFRGGGSVSTDEMPGTRGTLAVVPNPVTAASRVTLALDVATEGRVTVLDALGRTVALLHDGPLAAGQTTLALDAARLPAGVYAVVVQAGALRRTARVTVVR